MQRKIKIRGILLLLFILITTIYLIYNKSFFLLMTFWLLLIYIIFSLAVMKNWRKKELFGQRSSVILIIILFFLIIYGLRLFTIQFILKSKYVGQMNKQLISVSKEVGQRGAIYDSNGKKLAFNKRLYTISINPSLLNDEKIHDDILKDIMAIKDSGIITLSENIEEELLEMAKENIKYKRIARNIDDEQKKEIVDLIASIEREKVKGRAKYKSVLVFERSIDRKYYKSEEYDKLVGMVKETEDTNDEKVGISGLEKQYQNYLV